MWTELGQVARGHMFMPAFFVGKATRKEVSAADWAAMSPEERIKHLLVLRAEGLDKLDVLQTVHRSAASGTFALAALAAPLATLGSRRGPAFRPPGASRCHRANGASSSSS